MKKKKRLVNLFKSTEENFSRTSKHFHCWPNNFLIVKLKILLLKYLAFSLSCTFYWDKKACWSLKDSVKTMTFNLSANIPDIKIKHPFACAKSKA